MDRQKNKVYAWERRYIAPRDKSEVSYDKIQGIVNWVWTDWGLENPPIVKPLSKRIKIAFATGSRTFLSFKEDVPTPTWVILHEMAHSLTMNFEGDGDLHGGDFVGMYMQLVAKYLKISIFELMHTAKISRVECNIGVKPYLLQERFNAIRRR